MCVCVRVKMRIGGTWDRRDRQGRDRQDRERLVRTYTVGTHMVALNDSHPATVAHFAYHKTPKPGFYQCLWRARGFSWVCLLMVYRLKYTGYIKHSRRSLQA